MNDIPLIRNAFMSIEERIFDVFLFGWCQISLEKKYGAECHPTLLCKMQKNKQKSHLVDSRECHASNSFVHSGARSGSINSVKHINLYIFFSAGASPLETAARACPTLSIIGNRSCKITNISTSCQPNSIYMAIAIVHLLFNRFFLGRKRAMWQNLLDAYWCFCWCKTSFPATSPMGCPTVFRSSCSSRTAHQDRSQSAQMPVCRALVLIWASAEQRRADRVKQMF